MCKSTILLFFVWMGIVLGQVEGEHLRITSILEEPYLGFGDKVGDKFKGFTVDLAEKLSELLNSTYTLTLVEDASYGSQIGTSWTGMVGKIIRGEADMAIAALTITPNRAKVFDFSPPFLETRLAVLAMKDFKGEPVNGTSWSFNSFCTIFLPMTGQLWLALIFAAILTGIVLTIIEKKLKNIYEDEGAGDLFTFTPRSLAGRTIKLVFVIFMGFILAAYTANYGVLLSIPPDEYSLETHDIGSVEDLSTQTEIKYGVVRSGSTHHFFQKTTNPRYQSMLRFMEEHNTFVQNNDEGIQRVYDSKGTFAYIMESSKAKHVTTWQCDMKVAGNAFGPSKGFGVATQKNSKLSEQVKLAILELQEIGFLEELEKRWWDGVSTCSSSTQSKNPMSPVPIGIRPLTIENMAGIFVILIIGLIVAAVIAIFEIRVFKKSLI